MSDLGWSPTCELRKFIFSSTCRWLHIGRFGWVSLNKTGTSSCAWVLLPNKVIIKTSILSDSVSFLFLFLESWKKLDSNSTKLGFTQVTNELLLFLSSSKYKNHLFLAYSPRNGVLENWNESNTCNFFVCLWEIDRKRL